VGFLYVYDTETKQRIYDKLVHKNWITSVKYLQEFNLVATGSWDHVIKLFKVSTSAILTPVAMLRKHDAYIWNILYIPSLRVLVSSGDDKNLKIWDPLRKKLVGIISTHGEQEIRSETLFIPYYKLIAVGFCSRKISLYNIRTKQEVFTSNVVNKPAWPLSMTYIESTRCLYIGSSNAKIECWKVVDNH